MRAVALCLMLTGCCTGQVREVPGPVEYRDRIVVQPIPAELLREHPIAEGKLSECPDVAAERRKELELANEHKRILRERAGAPVTSGRSD